MSWIWSAPSSYQFCHRAHHSFLALFLFKWLFRLFGADCNRHFLSTFVCRIAHRLPTVSNKRLVSCTRVASRTNGCMMQESTLKTRIAIWWYSGVSYCWTAMIAHYFKHLVYLKQMMVLRMVVVSLTSFGEWSTPQPLHTHAPRGQCMKVRVARSVGLGKARECCFSAVLSAATSRWFLVC